MICGTWEQRAARLFGTLGLILGLFVTVWSGLPAAAQTAGSAGSEAAGEAGTLLDDLPEPLTAEAVREMVSRLSDAEVRDLLLHRLDVDIADGEDASEVESLLASIEANAAVFWRNSALLFPQSAKIPAGMAAAFGRLADGQGAAKLLTIFATILGVMAAGYGAERLAGLALNRLRPASAVAPMPGPAPLKSAEGGWRAALASLSIRFGIGLAGLFVFAAVSANLIFAFFPPLTSGRMFAMKLLAGLVMVRLTYHIAVFVLAPSRPDLRLCDADDATASYLTRQACLIVGLYGFGFGMLEWMWANGGGPGVGRFGYWTNFAVHAMAIWTLWQARHGITAMLVGRDGAADAASPGERRFAQIWPKIAMGLVFLEWLTVIIIAESGHVALLRLSAIFTTLAIIVILPFLDLILRAIGRNFDPVRPADGPKVIEARKATQHGVTRCGRVVLLAVLVVFITAIWGLDIGELAELGLGAQIAGGFVEIVLIALVAYGLWELVNILVSRRLALEAGEAEGEAEVGGEGAGSGSRIGTLLPLLRRVAQASIAIMAVLAILGNLGVNIAPLLAGAGIAGLAIGFGAQTLVKDIVSGVFFLVDDAFRIGEYIDVGDVMGTVEKISVRSLRLRHHLGAVHTVPYGEIAKLTNFSRDWVIVKLKFRVPFETDIGQVKRIFKQIGKDLWADPELGPDFLDPFKSQGVFDVDDSAIIVRGKFTAKPGQQFLIKREIFVRVQRAFDEAGIPFARRQVLVHMPGGEKQDDPRTRQAIANAAAAQEEEQLGDDAGTLGAPA